MTDDEYFKLLDRIVKGAEYLENPFIKASDKEQAMKLYDALVDQATKYKSWRRMNNE